MLPYIACRGLSTGTLDSASAQRRGASNISLHNPAARVLCDAGGMVPGGDPQWPCPSCGMIAAMQGHGCHAVLTGAACKGGAYTGLSGTDVMGGRSHTLPVRATAGSALELSLVTLTIMLDTGDAQALHAGTVDGALP